MYNSKRIYNHIVSKDIITSLQKIMEEWQQILITVIGWIYFSAWSLSFYGQIYENFKHKSVQGMNFDFVGMNMTGFVLYSLYNTQGYFISNKQTGQVDLNDVFFAYHALLATLVTLTQVFCFKRGKNIIHGYTILLLTCIWGFLIVWSTLVLGTKTVTVNQQFGVFSFMGYFKLVISFLKYLPQMYWNYQRKSTVGWSIFNILLDLTGGVFSFAQIGLEVIFGENVEINPVKFTLGIIVIFFDICFIVQHYCLYSASRKPKEETQDSGEYTKLVNNTQA